VLWDWYLSINRPYLYSLLPENTIKFGRFIVDTLYIKFDENWNSPTSLSKVCHIDFGEHLSNGLGADARSHSWPPHKTIVVFFVKNTYKLKRTHSREQLSFPTYLHNTESSLKSSAGEVRASLAFYGTRRFITMFTKDRHLRLIWSDWIQFTPSYPNSLTFEYYPPIFPSHLLTRTVYAFLTSPGILLYTVHEGHGYY
jgi:hypothetical protein